MISTSSAFASSTPATSAKVVFSSLRSKILCLLRPNDSACVGPPPTRRMRNIQIAIMTASGMTAEEQILPERGLDAAGKLHVVRAQLVHQLLIFDERDPRGDEDPRFLLGAEDLA